MRNAMSTEKRSKNFKFSSIISLKCLDWEAKLFLNKILNLTKLEQTWSLECKI